MSVSSQSSPSTSYEIFIAYRRKDSQATVDRLYEWLERAFGNSAIFMDVTSIPAGYSFPAFVRSTMPLCRVVLIVIGPSWRTLPSTEGRNKGQPRLNDPADHVRIEVEQALKLAPVDEDDFGRPTGRLMLIPLLVQGAKMPSANSLPESIRELEARNAMSIRRTPGFADDVKMLIDRIADWMKVKVPIEFTDRGEPLDPIANLLTRFVPQLCASFNEQAWQQVQQMSSFLQRNVPSDRLPPEVYKMQGRALMAKSDYARAKDVWDKVWKKDPMDTAARKAEAEACIGLGEIPEALTLLDDALTILEADDALTIIDNRPKSCPFCACMLVC